MRLLIDMNLSPEWVGVLAEAGFDAVHWSVIGSAGAPDEEILAWADLHEHVILTHDLDFGAILAATQAKFPSVLQVRSQDVNPHHLKDVVISALEQFHSELLRGALISIDEDKSRARILPIS